MNDAMIFGLTPRELRDAEITVTDAGTVAWKEEAPSVEAGKHDTQGA